jgi:hypothetical protein
MNGCLMTWRRIATRVTSSETDSGVASQLAHRRAHVRGALTSVFRLGRRRGRAPWLATIFVEEHRGERVWVTEDACPNKRSAMCWIETELNARRQEVVRGTEEQWRYVATLEKFSPPPEVTAYLGSPDTPIDWVHSDIVPDRVSPGKLDPVDRGDHESCTRRVMCRRAAR